MKATTPKAADPPPGQSVRQAQNIIPPPKQQRRKWRVLVGGHFVVKEFTNASGSISYRVEGYTRNGGRFRENFSDRNKAECKHLELQTEWLTGEVQTKPKATTLTDNQLRISETAFAKLGRDEDMLLAVQDWLDHGKALAVSESPRLDKATDEFLSWLETTDTIRPRTKGKYKSRVKMFRNSVPNLRIADIGPDTLETFFAKRKVSALTKVGDKEAISRFFSWCMARPRQWVKVNPCAVVEIERSTDGKEIQILTVEECRKLLNKAERHRGGRLAPYVAVCLFGGLRPTEAQRLAWDKVNLKDGEILVVAQSSKRKESRVVTIGKTLAAWLKRFKNKPFYPVNFRRDFEVIRRAAGYTGRDSKNPPEGLKPWPDNVLRHTGISHFFRNCGLYGDTAEWAGNSEAIIRKHYQGRVSTDQTKAFYALLPAKRRAK